MSNEQRIPSECLGAIGKSRISQGKTGLQNTSVSGWETVPGLDKTPTRLTHSSMRHKTIEYCLHTFSRCSSFSWTSSWWRSFDQFIRRSFSTNFHGGCLVKQNPTWHYAEAFQRVSIGSGLDWWYQHSINNPRTLKATYPRALEIHSSAHKPLNRAHETDSIARMTTL